MNLGSRPLGDDGRGGKDLAKRNVFYRFHYKPDNWRAAQVRSIGALEGNSISEKLGALVEEAIEIRGRYD